jgi:uncharacterized membrane protein YhaH (DUF805 family)
MVGRKGEGESFWYIVAAVLVIAVVIVIVIGMNSTDAMTSIKKVFGIGG